MRRRAADLQAYHHNERCIVTATTNAAQFHNLLQDLHPDRKEHNIDYHQFIKRDRSTKLIWTKRKLNDMSRHLSLPFWEVGQHHCLNQSLPFLRFTSSRACVRACVLSTWRTNDELQDAPLTSPTTQWVRIEPIDQTLKCFDHRQLASLRRYASVSSLYY